MNSASACKLHTLLVNSRMRDGSHSTLFSRLLLRPENAEARECELKNEAKDKELL